jgi:hypothetical protein
LDSPLSHMANPFPLSEVLKYDDELAAFYKDLGQVFLLYSWECGRTAQGDGKFIIWISAGVTNGFLLERNGENTYLLVEHAAEGGPWATYFAQDPKGAIWLIHEWFNDWPTILPLIRMAHAAAHPEGKREPDLKYLEHLMAKALRHFDPKGYITNQIKPPPGPGGDVWEAA